MLIYDNRKHTQMSMVYTVWPIVYLNCTYTIARNLKRLEACYKKHYLSMAAVAGEAEGGAVIWKQR